MIKIKVVIFLLFLFGGALLIGIGQKEVGTEKVLCVDGNHNINLEGIMCEKDVNEWFGLPMWISYVVMFAWTLISLSLMFNTFRGGKDD